MWIMASVVCMSDMHVAQYVAADTIAALITMFGCWPCRGVRCRCMTLLGMRLVCCVRRGVVIVVFVVDVVVS